MSLFDSLHVYDDTDPKSAALNMAVDEALLEAATFPSLRFYCWRWPSVSFGYFGRFTEVESYQPQRDVARRWTGGGIVFHGADLTYSIVVPANDSLFVHSSTEIYAALHERIRKVLRANRIDASLTSDAAPEISDACFANPVRADVVVGEQKVAGAAQRRTRRGILHQGSIQLDELPESFPSQFAEALCDSWKPMKPPTATLIRAAQLADEKYGTAGWLRRRM